MTDRAQISQDHAKRRLQRGLSIYIGHGRQFTVAIVSDATGIPDRTLRSYLDGTSEPPTSNLLRLMSVLPPAFADHFLEPIGLTVAARAGERPSDHTLAAHLAMPLAAVTEALMDGRIDHQERAKLQPMIRQAMAAMGPWVVDD